MDNRQLSMVEWLNWVIGLVVYWLMVDGPRYSHSSLRGKQSSIVNGQ